MNKTIEVWEHESAIADRKAKCRAFYNANKEQRRVKLFNGLSVSNLVGVKNELDL